MKVAIGCDHAGFELKEVLKKKLTDMGHSVEDCGTNSAESTDYPDYAHAVASGVENGTFELAVLICGSGNGISMTANKHQNVRSAICWTKEIAELARLHNNANILTLPARYIAKEQGMEILDTFFGTDFEGGRHERRVNKINC